MLITQKSFIHYGKIKTSESWRTLASLHTPAHTLTVPNALATVLVLCMFFSEYTWISEASEKVPVTDNQYHVCSNSTPEQSRMQRRHGCCLCRAEHCTSPADEAPSEKQSRETAWTAQTPVNKPKVEGNVCILKPQDDF